MDTLSDIAWAAGLFDGEGSVSTYLPRRRHTARRQMQVSQGGVVDQKPLVLARFQEIVGGVGNITGPYRGYLYYWKITKKPEVDEVGRMLWPYLGSEKRRQFAAAAERIGRQLPGPVDASRSTDPVCEAAWAAGLFDGEGTISVSTSRHYPNFRGAAMSLPQSSTNGIGIPENLTRFRAALSGLGGIAGPYPPRSPWSRLPQYRWSTSGRHKVTAVARILWPWLGSVKRKRLFAVADLLDGDFAGWLRLRERSYV